MAVEVWQNLPKAQDDDETIEEAIDRKVVSHLADVDAHLGENESLQSHRANDIIDHLAGSVVNDKLKSSARAFDAIVDVDSPSDYDDIQDAIDYVYSLGGGTIFITSGTYTITSALTLYPGIDLVGDGYFNTIIDRDDGTYIFDLPGISGLSDDYPYVQNFCNNIAFQNCAGRMLNPTTLQYGIKFDNCYFLDIGSFISSNTPPHGVVWFKDCNLDLSAFNYNQSCWNFIMENCTINITSTSVFINNCHAFYLLNCNFLYTYNSNGNSLCAGNNMFRVYVDNCYLKNVYTITSADSNGRLHITNNIWENPDGGQINFSKSGLVITGNDFILESGYYVNFNSGSSYNIFSLNRVNVPITDTGTENLIINNISLP